MWHLKVFLFALWNLFPWLHMENCFWCYSTSEANFYIFSFWKMRKRTVIYLNLFPDQWQPWRFHWSCYLPVNSYVKRFSDQMAAYVHGSPIDSDTLLICKTSGTHGRLDLSFGFSFSVLSLPKHKMYFQLRHVINQKADSFLRRYLSLLWSPLWGRLGFFWRRILLGVNTSLRKADTFLRRTPL